jgi:hypothetical protein
VDFLAYLLVDRGADDVDLRRWIPRVRRALGQLGLIVYVPLERPDRVEGAPVEYPRLRRRMDERLRELLEEDPWELGTAVLEVHGSAGERARQVLARLDDFRGAPG